MVRKRIFRTGMYYWGLRVTFCQRALTALGYPPRCVAYGIWISVHFTHEIRAHMFRQVPGAGCTRLVSIDFILFTAGAGDLAVYRIVHCRCLSKNSATTTLAISHGWASQRLPLLDGTVLAEGVVICAVNLSPKVVFASRGNTDRQHFTIFLLVWASVVAADVRLLSAVPPRVAVCQAPGALH